MDEALLELVKGWLMRARNDLRSAEILSAAADPVLDTAIYHCQQAAEKSLKAWLQSRDIPFPKTHDLGDLIEIAARDDSGFIVHSGAASLLTPYAIEFRYPGFCRDALPSIEEFQEAYASACSISNFVRRKLDV